MAQAATTPGVVVAVVRLRVPGLDDDGAPPNVLPGKKVLRVLSEVDLLEGRGDCGDIVVAGIGVDGTRELCVGITAFALCDCSAQTACRGLEIRSTQVELAVNGTSKDTT